MPMDLIVVSRSATFLADVAVEFKPQWYTISVARNQKDLKRVFRKPSRPTVLIDEDFPKGGVSEFVEYLWLALPNLQNDAQLVVWCSVNLDPEITAILTQYSLVRIESPPRRRDFNLQLQTFGLKLPTVPRRTTDKGRGPS